MARSTREWARNKYDMCTNHLEVVQGHTLEIVEIYQARFPEYGQQLDTFLTGIELMKETISRLKEAI